MAIIKAKVIRGGSAGYLVHYIGNPIKTNDCEFVTGIHCSPDANNAALDMEQIKSIYNKERGVKGYHIIQSFLPGEISGELAHEIGVSMANELWGDRFQIYVGTHIDKMHVHNHIFINSVSYRDGKKLHWNKTEYFNIRATSDRYCQSYGLSTLDSPNSRKYFETTKRFADKYMKTNPKMIQLRQDLDDAIYLATNFNDFVSLMGTFGYDISHEKKWDWKYYYAIDRVSKVSYKPEKLFGDNYSRIGIQNRILSTRGLKQDTYFIEGISKSLIASVYVPGLANYAMLILIINAVLEIALEIQKQNMKNEHVTYKKENLINGNYNYSQKISTKMLDRANKIIEMNNLLSENNIASESDLESFKAKLQKNISKLRNEKESLVISLKKDGNLDEISNQVLEIKNQIDDINKKLKIVNYVEGELRKIQAIKLVLERERDNTIQKQKQEKEIKKMKNRDAR